jgi:outer membrane protein OmpA-like peptidoglycan-associated protein
MGRVSASVAIVIVLGAGCAKRTTPGSEGAAATSAAPFTNQELVSELRRQGVGGATGQAGASGTESLPEITETPRGVVITLPNTFFAFDSSDLDDKARGVVNRIAQVLNNPRAANRKIMLEGHTDNVGTAAYNLALSRRRAEAVARELIKEGVRSDRVTHEAFGETRPVAPNRKPDGTDDPGGRAKNRRVEAVIPN